VYRLKKSYKRFRTTKQQVRVRVGRHRLTEVLIMSTVGVVSVGRPPSPQSGKEGGGSTTDHNRSSLKSLVKPQSATGTGPRTGIKDFIIIKKIGEGSYSSVWKVKRK
jgi:hypothetical protein